MSSPNKKAAERFKKYGKEKTPAEIACGGPEKKGEFKDRNLYRCACDFHGVCLAQGDNPRRVGQNLYDWQDADGRYNIRGHIDIAIKKGGGWSPVYKETAEGSKARTVELVRAFAAAEPATEQFRDNFLDST